MEADKPFAPALLAVHAGSFGIKVPQDDAARKGRCRIECYHNHGILPKARQQEAGVLLVLAKGVAELLRQHLLFLPGFDAIANQR